MSVNKGLGGEDASSTWRKWGGWWFLKPKGSIHARPYAASFVTLSLKDWEGSWAGLCRCGSFLMFCAPNSTEYQIWPKYPKMIEKSLLVWLQKSPRFWEIVSTAQKLELHCMIRCASARSRAIEASSGWVHFQVHVGVCWYVLLLFSLDQWCLGGVETQQEWYNFTMPVYIRTWLHLYNDLPCPCLFVSGCISSPTNRSPQTNCVSVHAGNTDDASQLSCSKDCDLILRCPSGSWAWRHLRPT